MDVELRWQTIATAPKDGTEILISWGHHVYLAKWHTDEMMQSFWMFLPSLGETWNRWHNATITHWMPKPEPFNNQRS